MATFLTNLFESIFTPGPTHTLIVATNVSFAALQLVLLGLLVATYSIHFIILSILSAGLWWAINWFVTELQAVNEEHLKTRIAKERRRDYDDGGTDDSGTETEWAEGSQNLDQSQIKGAGLKPAGAEGAMRKRRSLGEASGDMSTDSEWDKVEDEGEENRQ